MEIDNNRLDALGNADAIKPTAVRVPCGRAGDVSEVIKCQEPGCLNSEEYFGADVILRKKAMRFFRCAKCQESNRLRNQKGESRLCQACGTVFSHPIWFEEMLKGACIAIPHLCSDHGGVKSEFKCVDCSWVWIERRFDDWERARHFSVPRCSRCHYKWRFGTQGSVNPPVSIPKPPVPIPKAKAPTPKAKATIPNPPMKTTLPPASKTIIPTPERSIWRRIWDVLSSQ